MIGDDQRRTVVKRAYERARLRASLPYAATAVPLAVAAWSYGAPFTPLLGAVLAAVVALLRWRGGSVGRGAVVGLVVGLAPFTVLLLGCIGGTSAPVGCLTLCVGAALSAGLPLAIAIRGRSPAFGAAALGVAALVAALPCLVLGSVGLSVVPFLVVPTVPVFVWSRRATA